MGALVPFLIIGGAAAAAADSKKKTAAVKTAPETFDQWSSGKEGSFNDLYGQYKGYFDRGAWNKDAAAKWSDYDPGGVVGDYGDTAGIRYRDEAERKAAYQTAYDAAVKGAQDFATWSKDQGGTFNDKRAGYAGYLSGIYAAPTGISAKSYDSLLPGVGSDYGTLKGTYFETADARNKAERDLYNSNVNALPDFYTWYNNQGAGTYGNPNAALQEYTKLVEGVVDAAPGSVAQKASSMNYLKDASNISNYYSYLDDIGINTSNMDKTELQQAYGMGQSLEKKNQAIADVQGKLDTAKTQYDDLFGSYNTKLGELADVNQQMKDLQGSFNIVTGDYGGLQDTYDALKTQYGNLQDELGTYTSQMDSLQGTYDTLLGDYDTLVGQNKALVGDYGGLQTDFKGLQDKYGSLTEQYDAATGELTGLKDQYGNLVGQYDNLTGQYTDLQGAFDLLGGEYSGLQDKFAGLQTDYTGLQDKYGTLTEQYDAATGELTGLKDQYGNLVGQYDSLTGQYTDLQELYGSLGDKFAGLQTDYTGLQDKYGTLTEQYDAATGELTGLKDQYGNLVGQYDSLTGQYTDLRGAYDLLGGQYAGLQDQFAGLQTDYSGLQTQYGGLAKEFDLLQGQYGTAMSDLEAQKQAYDTAQQRIQQQYFGKLQDEAAANIAKEQARRQAIIEAGATMPQISVPSISPLDPGSYAAPTTNYALQLQNAAPNLFQPIDLSMPNVDFTSMYAPVPLAPQMTQSAPQMNFTAPFQPYLQAVQQQYGVSTPSAYTGIMGGRKA